MEDIELVTDLVVALGAALFGGFVARRLGQPVLLGYIVAGVLIGPNTPGLTADRDRVLLLANLGVAFLMFGLGVEFSFAELKRVRRTVLIAGAIEIPVIGLIGFAAGLAIGWSAAPALLLGGAFAISSSIVALKLLLSRGEVDSPHGRVALGLGVVQDLSLVAMLALVPLLARTDESFLPELIRSLATASIALAAVIVVGTRLVPRLLYAVAETGSRELFLLTVVLIALGTAFASHEAGLSLALGAFLAGLVVSESEFDDQVLAEIVPLRDVFATLFFVSVGMLIEPAFIADNALIVLGLVALLVAAKLVVTGGAFLAAGLDHRTATLGSLVMAQIGEFSFVLAGVGLSEEIIDGDDHALILAVALGSILVVPVLFRSGPALVSMARHLPGVAAQELAQAGPEPDADRLARHVVICGYGRVGAVLGDVLQRRGLRFAVIDLNPTAIRDLKARGIVAYYGDAGSSELLLRAGIERARSIAVAMDDLVASRAVIRHARRLNPTIDVITRAVDAGEMELMRSAGADEVVQPEFEAGLEFVRHVLRQHGVPARDVTAILGRRRSSFYETDILPPFREET